TPGAMRRRLRSSSSETDANRARAHHIAPGKRPRTKSREGGPSDLEPGSGPGHGPRREATPIHLPGRIGTEEDDAGFYDEGQGEEEDVGDDQDTGDEEDLGEDDEGFDEDEDLGE